MEIHQSPSFESSNFELNFFLIKMFLFWLLAYSVTVFLLFFFFLSSISSVLHLGFSAAHITVQSDQTMDPVDSGFAFEEPKSKILTWCEGIPQPILQGNSVRSSGWLHFMKILCITRHCRKALQCELSNTGNSVEGHTSSSPLQSSSFLSLQLSNSVLLLDQKSLTSLPFQPASTRRHQCSYQATASLSSPIC